MISLILTSWYSSVLLYNPVVCAVCSVYLVLCLYVTSERPSSLSEQTNVQNSGLRNYSKLLTLQYCTTYCSFSMRCFAFNVYLLAF